jgi:hypothetical protein
VDGKDSGLVTPATLAIQGEDPSRIRFVKSGFRPAEVSITSELLAAGAVTSRLEAIPAPRPVTVVARGNYPFDVVDGRRVLSGAATSHEVRVTGARVLRLQAPAFLLDYQVRVPANAASPFEIEVPDLGRISIRSTMETCRVTLGGKDVGFPPITEMRVAAGTYDVALDCPDGREVRGASVTIVGGQTLLAKIP